MERGMMMKILLCCAMGMSTSVVVQAMKKSARAQGKDYKIWATDADSVDEEDDCPDVVLIGPQVGYKLEDLNEYFEGTKTKVAVMDKTQYGNCDGAAIVKFAEALYRG